MRQTRRGATLKKRGPAYICPKDEAETWKDDKGHLHRLPDSIHKQALRVWEAAELPLGGCTPPKEAIEMRSKKEEAQELLIWYFDAAVEQAKQGGEFSHSAHEEMGAIVSLIIDAAVERIKAELHGGIRLTSGSSRRASRADVQEELL